MSHTTRRHSVSAATRGVALVLFVAACGAGDSPLSPIGFQRRLELTMEGPPPEPPKQESYRTLTVPSEIAPWVVRADRTKVGPLPGADQPGAPPVLLMLDAKPKEIRVPGAFDPVHFNQIALDLVVRVDGTLHVEARRGQETVADSGAVGLNPRLGPQRVVIELAIPGEDPVDELIFRFDAAAGPVALIALELQLSRQQERSPLVPGERGLARVGDQSRAAWGLSGEHELRGQFRVADGDVLRFGARVVMPPAAGAKAPRLIAILAEAGRENAGSSEHELLLRDAWSDQRIDLTPFAGRECSVNFRVQAEGSEPVSVLLEEPVVGRPRPDAPLVLLITSDTHRGDHLGRARDGAEVRTPTLDALAARGVFFERAHSSTNVTIPSHAALFTGVTPRDTGVRSNQESLGEAAPTLAEAFREAGWNTVAAISARHLFEIGGAGQGFDRIDAPHGGPQRPGGETLLRLQEWLPAYDGYPLFVWLHLFDPHEPYLPPAEFREEPVSIPPPQDPSELYLRKKQALYRGEIHYVDSLVGQLLEGERFDGAIIALTGDHGENLGEHGLLFNHAELYPQVVHVPLLLTWPGAPAGARVEGPISHLGMARTLLDLAGLEGVGFPGQSLLVALEEGAPSEPLFALADGARSASVRLGDDYLILHLIDHQLGKARPWSHGETSLYDLGEDPNCVRDLCDQHPERARRLRELLVRWLSAPEALGWAHRGLTTPEQRAELAALGYTEIKGSGDATLIDPNCDCDWCSRFRGQ